MTSIRGGVRSSRIRYGLYPGEPPWSRGSHAAVPGPDRLGRFAGVEDRARPASGSQRSAPVLQIDQDADLPDEIARLINHDREQIRMGASSLNCLLSFSQIPRKNRENPRLRAGHEWDDDPSPGIDRVHVAVPSRRPPLVLVLVAVSDGARRPRGAPAARRSRRRQDANASGMNSLSRATGLAGEPYVGSAIRLAVPGGTVLRDVGRPVRLAGAGPPRWRATRSERRGPRPIARAIGVSSWYGIVGTGRRSGGRCWPSAGRQSRGPHDAVCMLAMDVRGCRPGCTPASRSPDPPVWPKGHHDRPRSPGRRRGPCATSRPR